MNHLASPGARWLEHGFDAGRLLDAARRRTGLQDFGDESFLPPLERLLHGIRTESSLTPTGALITRTRLLGVLENRLRLEALYAEHPEIEAQQIREPIIIAGLQRTGTTLLHRLLASHPRLRWLAAWEALSPVPGPGVDRRLSKAQFAERALRYLSPAFFAIHPVEAEAPEEEVLLLDYSFRSTVAEATLRVPSFSRWLESADQLPAYRYLERLLKALQWQHPKERWVLKTPHHLEWLDTLLHVFPDAKIVQTHRDPTRTLASFCSMIWHGRAVFSDRVDAAEIGHDWERKTLRMVTRGSEVRGGHRKGTEHFLDVYYQELMRDPTAELERISDFAGLAWTASDRAKLQQARGHNQQNKHGVHKYRLEDFGLSAERTRERFADYIERYAIPREG
ncbi:MAG: sulfotransferase [Polyangiaceae bacterium]